MESERAFLRVLKGVWLNEAWFCVDCILCGSTIFTKSKDLTCYFHFKSYPKPARKHLARKLTAWVRMRYMDDLEEYLQAVRTLPQPLWEEIEPEFYFPFKSWKESMLSTAQRNTDGTTPTLLQLWERSLVEERVPIVAPFAEIQTILTPSAGADCSVEGARGSTRPQHIPPQCTVPFY